MNKIKRPDWNDFVCGFGTDLDKWFEENIEPINKIIEEAIEVYGCEVGDEWVRTLYTTKTHKALLINIQPINKETAEDVLNDIMDYFCKSPLTSKEHQLIERAKAVLGE